jgi:hypothetical protein
VQGALQIPPAGRDDKGGGVSLWVGLLLGETEWIRVQGAPQIPPLRFAPVGMTKGRGVAYLGSCDGMWGVQAWGGL